MNTKHAPRPQTARQYPLAHSHPHPQRLLPAIVGHLEPLFEPPIQRVGGSGQGCVRREGTSEAAPKAVRQAVGGGCRSGWGRLLSVTNAIEAGTCRQGDSGWA